MIIELKEKIQHKLNSEIQTKQEKEKGWLLFGIILLFMHFIPILYYMPCKVVPDDNPVWLYLLNAIPSICLGMFFLMVHLNVHKGIKGVLGVYTLWGLVNAIIVSIRGNIILPADIKNLSTAMEVAEHYTPKFTLGIFFGIIGTITCYLASRMYCRINFVIGIKKRISIALASLVILIGWVFGISFNNQFLFKQFTSNFHQYETDNAVYAGPFTYFFMNLNLKTNPDGYDKTNCQKILAQQQSIQVSGNMTDKPNVIVIMNEAFADLTVDGITLSQDSMPYVHSLTKSDQAVTGYLHTSIFGGLTACTEYEFLTGHSLRFYNGHSVPYNDMHNPVHSIVDLMENEGYQSLAIHPYPKAGYHRNDAYQYLGFNKSVFMEDMDIEESDCRKNLLYDQAFYEYLADTIDKTEEPVFSFNVTIQNHSPFNEKNEKIDADTELNNYVSLIRKSDDAFKWLVEHYEKSNKPTVIVMFGDHQPGLTEYKYPETENLYTVPFVMWSNCGIKSEHDIELSANYGGLYLMKQLGIPLSPYFSWLEELRQQIPILTQNYYCKGDHGKKFTDTDRDMDKLLEEYQNLQYYMFHDEYKN